MSLSTIYNPRVNVMRHLTTPEMATLILTDPAATERERELAERLYALPDHDEAFADWEKAAADDLDEMAKRHSEEMNDLRDEHAEALEELRDEHAEIVADLEAEIARLTEENATMKGTENV